MDENLKKVLVKLPKEVVALFVQGVSGEELEKALQEANVQLGVEDLKQLKEALSQGNMELSETDLEQIAGGCIFY